MTKANQLILYNFYIKLSKEGKTPSIRKNAVLHAEDILKSPSFAEFEEVKTETKKYTEKELYAMNKAEQVIIIKKLGKSIANTEKERVNDILEAQC